MAYYVVIPAHNEAEFLPKTLEALTAQTLAPKKVVIVNDNSTDETEKVIDAFTAKNSNFIKRNRQSSTIHMPGSKVVNTFNYGLSELDNAYDFLVKLDADVVIPPDYFESIADIFKNNPRVGIAGGFAYEQDASGIWKRNHPMNKDHVRGAFKSYTRTCFKAIGGLKSAMGWDTVDELLAEFHDFQTFTDERLKVKHLRPLGAAYNKRAKFLQGEAMYAMRYGLLITLIASLKMAVKLKKPRAFTDNLRGFLAAIKNRKPFIVSAEEGRFIRKLRWKRIREKLF
ncbi:MAG: glycosyltransferase family 2 protein [Eudoraea sp.]|nr:glycosyltransferase family 2 protein [Eudoraea sp.]